MIKYAKTRYSSKFGYHEADEVIGRSLALYGEYSQFEVDFLLQLLTPESVVYDIGGNIGYQATAFASRAKKVYSFEPNAHNYYLLMNNTYEMPNVHTMNCAVGATNGVIKCVDYNPMIPGNFGSIQVGVESATIPVPLVTIDSLELEKPNLIKIDVEGSEYDVLRGAIKTITEHKPVLFYEAHETEQFREIYELIKPLGYKLYWGQVNNYNPNNFAGNIVDVFGNTALFSIIGVPLEFPDISLDEVLGPDDSFEKLLSRARARTK
jgi:FkbM family methyltransferase